MQRRWIDSCEFFTAQELFLPAPGCPLHLVKCDWDWAPRFAPCVVLKRTGVLRVGLPALVLLGAALELYRGIWSGWMRSEHGFWISPCALLLAGDVARALAPGGQDLCIRGVTVGAKGRVLRRDLQKSLMLLHTLSVVLYEKSYL